MTSSVTPVDTPQGPAGCSSILLNSRARSSCSAMAPAAASVLLILNCWLRTCRQSVPAWCGSNSPGVPPGARLALRRPSWTRPVCCAGLAGRRGVAPASAPGGGRSAGARVACRTASTRAGGNCVPGLPAGLPGRPDKSRVAELLAPDVPRLVLQGTKDSFGTPEEILARRSAGARYLGGVAWSRSQLPDRRRLSRGNEQASENSPRILTAQPSRAPHDRCWKSAIHRRCSGNIDIMTALHITCPYWWMATSSRCCAPRHYSRT